MTIPQEFRTPRFTLEQVILLVVFIFGLGGGVMLIQTSLLTNKALLAEQAMTLEELRAATRVIRDHQVNNEYLIDQHSAEIEMLQQKLGIMQTYHRKASSDIARQ